VPVEKPVQEHEALACPLLPRQCLFTTSDDVMGAGAHAQCLSPRSLKGWDACMYRGAGLVCNVINKRASTVSLTGGWPRLQCNQQARKHGVPHGGAGLVCNALIKHASMASYTEGLASSVKHSPSAQGRCRAPPSSALSLPPAHGAWRKHGRCIPSKWQCMFKQSRLEQGRTHTAVAEHEISLACLVAHGHDVVQTGFALTNRPAMRV